MMIIITITIILCRALYISIRFSRNFIVPPPTPRRYYFYYTLQRTPFSALCERKKNIARFEKQSLIIKFHKIYFRTVYHVHCTSIVNLTTHRNVL